MFLGVANLVGRIAHYFGLRVNQADRPTSRQLYLCREIGLKVPAGVSVTRLALMIVRAIEKEPFKSKYDELLRSEAEMERWEREEYGDEIYDLYREWEALCDPFKQYLIVYRRGKKILSEVVELESAEVVGTGRHRVELHLLLPKIRRDRELGDSVEWEKEGRTTPDKVLFIAERSSKVDIYDVPGYRHAKEECERLAQKFLDGQA